MAFERENGVRFAVQLVDMLTAHRIDAKYMLHTGGLREATAAGGGFWMKPEAWT
jgi:hypothetical protein